jgi:cell division transport system permease protein
MLRWLFASPAERRLLAGGRLGGPTPWVIAIMSFSIMIIAAAGMALATTAGTLSRSIEQRYSIVVPNGAANLDAIAAAVRQSPGVIGVDSVPERDMRETLRRWLGPAADSADLPVPALVSFDLRPGADSEQVEQRVRSIAPLAQVTPHRESVAPLLRSLRLLQWLALGLVALLSVAACAAVVLAARGALDTHRSTIEVMHGVGATDLQVTHLFQRKIAIDAFVGSVVGGAAAGVVLLLLASGAAFAGELTGGATLSATDLVFLLLLPLALTVVATWIARTAVLAALRQAL